MTRFVLSALAAASLFAAVMLSAASSPADAQSANSAAGDENDPTRPVRSFDLSYRYEDDSSAQQNDKQFLTFRLNYRIDLTSQWRIGLRADMPLVASNAISTIDPEGSYQFGGGRPLFQAYLADIVNDRWAFAIGNKFTAPTLSGSQFGSGNWEAFPGFAVRYMLPEISPGSYFVPQIAYAFSFAQSFPGRNTSNLEFAPQLKIALKDRWFAILYPSTDIRLNFGDPLSGQTGRLFLPLDVSVGRNITNDITASLEVSVPIVDDYPVYRLKTEARLSINF